MENFRNSQLHIWQRLEIYLQLHCKTWQYSRVQYEIAIITTIFASAVKNLIIKTTWTIAIQNWQHYGIILNYYSKLATSHNYFRLPYKIGNIVKIFATAEIAKSGKFSITEKCHQQSENVLHPISNNKISANLSREMR